MPNFARINATDGAADYANVVLWEAGEDGADYGVKTVGICEDFYTLTANIQFRNGFINGFELIALAGQEAKVSDITYGAGFGDGTGTTYNIDMRVSNGEFTNLRVQGKFYSTGDTRQNTKIENCVTTGFYNEVFIYNTALINTLAFGVFLARNDNASISNSTLIYNGSSIVVRSRNATTTVTVNNSVAFSSGGADGFNSLNGGLYLGDYNAANNAGSTPGANSITNLSIVASNVFTNPAGGDYSPKVGGPLDGASSTGGFIGAVDLGGGGISIGVTEAGPSFTESINTNLSVNITGAIVENGPAFTEAVNVTLTSLTLQANITESGPSFTESITATLTETLTINADIAEQGPSFTESITSNLGVNITSVITELGPSFTESININVIGDRVASIVESGPSFVESIIASIPITITVNPKNIIRVKRKDNTVIIKRKSNIIRVR